jgi:N-acetyltransferase
MTDRESPWFERRELVGPRLLLTPLEEDDAQQFLAALGEPAEAAEVVEHLSYGPPADLDGAREILRQAVTDPERIAYGQRLRETGELVGTTSFYEISPGNRSIAIGHTWLARRCWRTGLNTESKLLMLRRAFDELGAERVVWHTDIRNTRSQAAIERLGATREGVLRHHRVRRDGTWRDTVQYSMLRAEWPPVRTRLVEQLPLAVDRDDQRSRYRATIGAEPVGVIDFRMHDGVVVVTHTGTEPAWRHCGIAARVTAHALADIRRRGLRVRAVCSYTHRYLTEHPEHADLVA